MTGILQISYEKFLEKYKPIENHFAKGTDLFETYGKELDFVKQQPLSRIWTLLCEDDDMWVVSGFHHVNRMNYLITERSWGTAIQLDYC